MTENDIKFRQGRSKKQVESTNKATGWSLIGLLITVIYIYVTG